MEQLNTPLQCSYECQWGNYPSKSQCIKSLKTITGQSKDSNREPWFSPNSKVYQSYNDNSNKKLTGLTYIKRRNEKQLCTTQTNKGPLLRTGVYKCSRPKNCLVKSKAIFLQNRKFILQNTSAEEKTILSY